MNGIDIPIEDLRAALATEFPNCSVWGRIFRNKRGDAIVPARFDNNRYYDVLQDDTKYGIIFFDIEPERKQTNGLISAEVNICFLLDLLKIYPTESRPTELVHENVEKIIRHSQFRTKTLVTGIKSLSQFSIDDTDDMNPFYIFAFKTELNYNLLNF